MFSKLHTTLRFKLVANDREGCMRRLPTREAILTIIPVQASIECQATEGELTHHQTPQPARFRCSPEELRHDFPDGLPSPYAIISFIIALNWFNEWSAFPDYTINH